MPIKYSDGFKAKAVFLLKELVEKKGEVIIEGKVIKNVRELVKFLGISTYSLYKWKMEMLK